MYESDRGSQINRNTNPLKRVLQGVWSAIDSTRKVVVNLLCLVIAIAILAMLFSNDDPKIAKTTALVIKPQGQLVEQLTAKSFKDIVDEACGALTAEVLLKDVIDSIGAAKDDDRVQVLVLNLSSFTGARLTKLQDVAKGHHLT